MPLLVPPPPADVPLNQGDILDLPPLHGTGVDGSPCDFKAKFGLVVSRDCVGAHKPQVLVASVVEARDRQVSDGEMEEIKKAEKPYDALPRVFHGLIKSLEATRDGGLSPDRVYLGPLPGTSQRLVAKLDEITTVQLPADAGQRQEWVSSRRRARFSEDAARAFPTRLFWAFSRVGFDDYEWLPDPDLRSVCDAGDAALGALQARAATLRLEVGQLEAGGERPEKVAGLRGAATNAEEARAKLEQELAPYRAERLRRSRL